MFHAGRAVVVVHVGRVDALLATLRAADACECHDVETPLLPSDHRTCASLRAGLGSLLGSKLSPELRGTAIQAATTCCSSAGSSVAVAGSMARFIKASIGPNARGPR